MLKGVLALFGFMVCLISFGCHSPVVDPVGVNSTDAILSIVGPCEKDVARVVFFRPKKVFAFIIKYNIADGGVDIGTLGNGEYFIVNAAPGEHVYSVGAEKASYMLEAGKVYFVSSSVGIGFWVGRPHLEKSSRAEFDRALFRLSVSKK